jgi:hypothetical protein
MEEAAVYDVHPLCKGIGYEGDGDTAIMGIEEGDEAGIDVRVIGTLVINTGKVLRRIGEGFIRLLVGTHMDIDGSLIT